MSNLSVQQAEELIRFYGSREQAEKWGEESDWDEAYEVALSAHTEQCAPMIVNGQRVR